MFIFLPFVSSPALAEAGEISAVWHSLWEELLKGDFYGSLSHIGSVLAVMTLLFFMLKWSRQMMDGHIQRSISDFIWPILVISLLSSKGAVLSNVTRGLHDSISYVNQTIITAEFDSEREMTLSSAFTQALRQEGDRQKVIQKYEQCQELQDEEMRANCEKTHEIPESPSYLSSASQTQTWVQLIALHDSFRWLIEAIMLLIGILGPLAVGGTLLPVALGAKPIVVWLSGFFAIGLAKISFNTLAGLASFVVITADEVYPLTYAAFLGLLAPVLAMAIATASSLSIFNGLSSSTEYIFGISMRKSRR